MLRNWFEKMPFGASKTRFTPDGTSGQLSAVTLKPRAQMRVGIPKTLNLWSTHQFWIGFLESLGIGKIDFSSNTSEEQVREFGKGRGTVDCCYPVKCMSGHYGEFLARKEPRKVDLLLSPMISSLPSFLQGHVVSSLTCPRVMAAPENIKSGFQKEKDLFAEHGIRYVTPFVALGDKPIVPKQLYEGLRDYIPGLTKAETRRAVEDGFHALETFNASMRKRSRKIIEQCVREEKPCILVLARPYHMDPGIGHEIETDLQVYGYPVLWAQYLPTDAEMMEWLFGPEIEAGDIKSAFDISDVWPSSYSANTNEILWGAKVAARLPWVACVVRLSSYECGMDQPTYSPVQQIVERSGTLYFSFQDIDSTKPAGSVKIRVETIAHYLQKYSEKIIKDKRKNFPLDFPLTQVKI
jgi:predicted nucleotide-binding protein (sugar kinase/HSP70/actin superfamily)